MGKGTRHKPKYLEYDPKQVQAIKDKFAFFAKERMQQRGQDKITLEIINETVYGYNQAINKRNKQGKIPGLNPSISNKILNCNPLILCQDSAKEHLREIILVLVMNQAIISPDEANDFLQLVYPGDQLRAEYTLDQEIIELLARQQPSSDAESSLECVYQQSEQITKQEFEQDDAVERWEEGVSVEVEKEELQILQPPTEQDEQPEVSVEQEQCENINKLTVPVSPDDGQGRDQFPEQPQEIPQQLAMSYPVQAKGNEAEKFLQAVPSNAFPYELLCEEKKEDAEVLALLSEEQNASLPQVSSVLSRAVRTTRNLTSFIGREQEIEDICMRIENPAVRLLTLTGPYGVGKTELAWQVKQQLEQERGFEVVKYISLKAVNSYLDVLPAITVALELEEQKDEDYLHLLVKTIKGQTLLILDSFEHVAKAKQDLKRLLSACLQLKLLIVNRTSPIEAEYIYTVLPLETPDRECLWRLQYRTDAESLPEEVLKYDAVLLFQERARMRNASFRITPENSLDIALVCLRLDGLPFAIEQAATNPELFVELSSKPPHKVLACGFFNALEESYNLLTYEDQRLFRYLALFGEGSWFSQHAVKAIFKVSESALFSLTQFVNKGLLQRNQEEKVTRYRMLSTTWQYVTEKLLTNIAFIKCHHNKNMEKNGLDWLQKTIHFVTAFNERSTKLETNLSMLRRYRDYYLFFLELLLSSHTDDRYRTYQQFWQQEADNIYIGFQWSQMLAVEEPLTLGRFVIYGYLLPLWFNIIPPFLASTFERYMKELAEEHFFSMRYKWDNTIPAFIAEVIVHRHKFDFEIYLPRDSQLLTGLPINTSFVSTWFNEQQEVGPNPGDLIWSEGCHMLRGDNDGWISFRSGTNSQVFVNRITKLG